MAIEDYYYPNIEPTDYIDESLDLIKARDDASRVGFRRLSTFPVVTENDVGMKVYIIGQGNFQLVSASEDSEPEWKQLSSDTQNPAYTDWVIENYQPLSEILTALSKLTTASGAVPFFNGPSDVQSLPISGYMKNVLSLTDDAEVRQALNMGSMATLDSPIDARTTVKAGSITVDKLDTSLVGNIGFSTGDVKLTYKSVADEGWILADDGTIGDSLSRATTPDNRTEALFKLMWNYSMCTLLTNNGGNTDKTTADADWGAHKRLVLPKMLGRNLAMMGNGSGLVNRVMGESTLDELSLYSEKTTEIPPAGDPYLIVPPSTFMNVMIKL